MQSLLDGLLEPQSEDRITSAEGLDIISGRAQVRTRKPRPSRAAALAAGDTQMQRQLLQTPGRGQIVRKPAGTRVLLTRTPTKLDIEIPPEGLSGSSIGGGMFAIVWNAFVAFWTFSALASGGLLFALFSAPFWFAGYQLASSSLSGALLKERFAIGRNKFRLSQELAMLQDGAAKFLGNKAKTSEGGVVDLSGARIITTVVVNGVPQTAIELVEGVNKYR